MGAILDTAKTTYAAGPASDPVEPNKSEIIQLFGIVDGALTSVVDGMIVGGAVVYSTRALLYADLAHLAGKLGVVYNDATAAYNGIYVKSGGSGAGSWAITNLALPSTFAADLAAALAAIDAFDGDIDGKLDNSMATARILGRTTASTGVVEQLTGAQVKTLLAIGAADVVAVPTDRLLGRDSAGTGTAEHISLTGGLAFTGSSQISLADAPQATFKGRVAGAGTGTPTDMTVAQVKTALAITQVDDTSDEAKPVSTAQQAALDLKANKAVTVTRNGLVGGTGGTLGGNLTFDVPAASSPEAIAGAITNKAMTPASTKAATDDRIGLGSMDIDEATGEAEVFGGIYDSTGDDLVLDTLQFPGGVVSDDGEVLLGVDREARAHVGGVVDYGQPLDDESGPDAPQQTAGFEDENGVPLGGPDADGVFAAAGIDMASDVFPDLDAQQFVGGTKSADGHMLHGIKADGTNTVGAVEIVGIPDGLELDAPQVPNVIMTGADNAPLVTLDEDGFTFEPSTDLADRVIAKAGGGSGVSATLRSGAELRNAVETSDFLIGEVYDRDGYSPKVVERKAGVVPTAVISSSLPLELLLALAQSNGGPGGLTTGSPAARKLMYQVFRYSVFGFAQGTGPNFWTSGATSEIDPSLLTDLIAYYDWNSPQPGRPQNQHAMTAYGAEMAYRAAGGPSPGILAHVDWAGGEPIQTFLEGEPNFENMILHAERFAEIAALYGRTVVSKAVYFTQGESGGTDYQDSLDALVTSIRTRVQAATGQASPPVVLIKQTNIADTAFSGNSYALDQLAVALARPTEAMITGPMYQGRLVDTEIHPDAESRMMIGEVDGEVYRRVSTGQPWYPVRMFSAERSGAIVDIKYTASDASFQLAGDDLEFDPGPGQPGDGWVKPIANYGFRYIRNGSPLTISSAAVRKDPNGRGTIVRLTLSSDPGALGTETIRYALGDAGDTTADGWSSARGQLRSRGRRSTFRQLGFAVPEFVWFYALKQEISVS